MARKLRLESPGAIYHVMFRGNGEHPIFDDDDDRARLTKRMEKSAERFEVRVFQYCRVNNRGHLLIDPHKRNPSAFIGSMRKVAENEIVA